MFAGGTATMVGLALAAFSQAPKEDELTRKLRLGSVYRAVMTGIGMLMGGNTIAFFMDGSADFYRGTALMCAVLCFFLGRFHSARRDLRPDTSEA